MTSTIAALLHDLLYDLPPDSYRQWLEPLEKFAQECYNAGFEDGAEEARYPRYSGDL